MSRTGRRLPALLAAAGLFLSIFLQVSHVRTYFDPDAIEFCNVGERLDCVSVALSRASVLLNVPVAFWGIVGFTLLLFALRRRPPLVLPLALAAALATTALLIVEIVVIRSLCLFCEAVHLITLWLLYLAWRQRDLPATFTYLRSPRALARDLAVERGLSQRLVAHAPLHVMPRANGQVRLPPGSAQAGIVSQHILQKNIIPTGDQVDRCLHLPHLRAII